MPELPEGPTETSFGMVDCRGYLAPSIDRIEWFGCMARHVETGETVHMEGRGGYADNKVAALELLELKVKARRDSMPKFDFTQRDGETLTPRSAVFQALGAASMCWTETPRGIFESERAAEIGEALLLALGYPATSE